MNRIRFTHLVFGALCGGILLIGFLLGVRPLLENAATAQDETARIEGQNALLEQSIAQLQSESEQLAARQGELAELQREIPPAHALDAYLDQLHDLATGTGVRIQSVRPAEARPYVPSAAAPAPTAPADPALPADTAPPASAPDAPPAAAGTVDTSAWDGRLGSSTLTAIPVEISIAGDANGVRSFVEGLQRGDRYTLLHRVSLSGGGEPVDALAGETSATLSGIVWVLP
ncbi:hypothetical protein [Microbacterium album]|uniref:Tfp pilus assembly protein PilO n=1 Tax=Microbacterium album TaxID=2053191 RepID=A0A917IIZ8_9MICO|nr:hypothetical protein [Microbacterium album]GGH50451.1 hypothetical protein GCM10010921_29220 [Microbacterium album]